jgi:hypothetical protein
MVKNGTAEFPGSVDGCWEMLQVYYQVLLMFWGLVLQGFQAFFYVF